MKHIFYHGSDNDGRASGAVCKKALPDAILHPFEYDHPFPFAELAEGDEVILTDVIPPFPQLTQVLKSHDTTIIDHHASLVNFLGTNGLKVKGIQRVGKQAACSLCWEHFFPGQPAPTTVRLLSAYDCWDNADATFWAQVVMPFQYGIRRLDIDPSRNWPFWQAIFLLNAENEDFLATETVKAGHAILEYTDKANAEIMRSNCFEAEFHRLRAVCCNSNQRNTQAFASVWDESKHDLMVAFEVDKRGLFRVGLYTSKTAVDVSLIALEHGGGGHKMAAGFSAKRMTFEAGRLVFEA